MTFTSEREGLTKATTNANTRSSYGICANCYSYQKNKINMLTKTDIKNKPMINL